MLLIPNPRSLEELLLLDPKDFKDIVLPPEIILQWLELCGAAWCHSGNPEDPHAVLTSGLCSDGFFNCLLAFENVNLLEIFADQLAIRIKLALPDQKIDWIIGSPMAGITFSYMVARSLSVKNCFFTEKDPNNSDEMIWNRTVIPEGKLVMNIEELITTRKTLSAVRRAVDKSNPYPVHWLPAVGVFVHRPPVPNPDYKTVWIIPVIEKTVIAVPKDECHLCMKGSTRLPAKTHWEELIKRK